jgi:hypothetical protein
LQGFTERRRNLAKMKKVLFFCIFYLHCRFVFFYDSFEVKNIGISKGRKTMKNLFLTSGLAILLVGSAFADPYDINNDQNHTLLNDPNNGTASCQHPTLGSYTGPTTFFAKWDPNEYTITYDKGSLSCNQAISGNSPTSQNFDYATTDTLSANGYSATGYSFVGWLSNKKLTTVAGTCGENDCIYEDEQSITYTYPGNSTLVAQWRPHLSGDITLDADKYNSAGTSVMHSVTNPYPIRSRYGTNMIEGLCTGFLDQGGNAIGGCQVGDNDISSITAPTLTGYDFAGFYTEKNGGGIKVINANGTFIDCVTTRQISETDATATWYAKWVSHVSGAIVLDSSIYTGNDHTTVKYDATTAAAATTSGITTSTPTPLYSSYDVGLFESAAEAQGGASADIVTQVSPASRAGYTFDGFFTSNNTQVIDSGGNVLPAALTAISGTNVGATWYAHWTPYSWKVVYNCGKVPTGASTGTPGSTIGGTAPDDGQPVYDANFALAPNAGDCAGLNGYHFAGWHCDYDLYTSAGNAIDYIGDQDETNPNIFTVSTSGTVAYTGDGDGHHINCSAIWRPNTVKTNWMPNGGALTAQGGENCTYDSTIGIPATIPTRTGYSFNGWTTEVPGSNNNNNNGGGTGTGGNNGGSQVNPGQAQ